MNLLNKMKKNRKGFTLVEIIVVLVILAVLAAFTIPTMLGFVNEAKGKALIAEAREVYVAAQATATEYGAQGTAPTGDALGSVAVATATNGSATASGATVDNKASWTMQNYLSSDLKPDKTVVATPTSSTVTPYWTVVVDSGKVTSVIYTRNGYTVTLDPNSDSTTVVKV